ncbi:beta-1,3-galactosyltransferase 1-like [Cimex lectularius]|uniref:Hexosyltransferase n=1 Tax=Cimex lectularius TaxID=79782 RepID=A0A8I6SBH8_CIMLE|nr:beta-1,3-galactosyltransferase 1-like [Cimex lectularius]XP_014261344.1 beta-1,3-galactosyltransferase 1-like [Cimex lectularius]XP_014261347.1 beta-1,3-galactosyltransferase 1-like [Cimex lectularius]
MLLGCEWKKLLRYVVLITVFIIYTFAIYFPDYKRPPVKQVAGWELNVTRDVRVYVVPENITSIISGKNLCEDQKVNVIIIVCSAPENVDRRLAIRQTWGLHNFSNVRVGFLLGWTYNISLQIQIEQESSEYHDVIQENFIDSYNNLTIKSVMMLKWYIHYCPSSTYLMKTDDDVFVNVTNLSRLLENLNYTVVLLGSLICHAKPILDVNNKWYSPKYLYRKAFYPNYLSGTGYVMSRQVAVKLFNAALTTPLIHLEDVYITGICALKAGVKPKNNMAFTYLHLSDNCLLNMITNHRMTPQELYILWKNRNNCVEKPRLTATHRTKLKKIQSDCH